MSCSPIGGAEIVTRAGATCVGLDIKNADPKFIDSCHAAGIQVFIWTISNKKDIEYCEKLGRQIDGLVLDYPLQYLS